MKVDNFDDLKKKLEKIYSTEKSIKEFQEIFDSMAKYILANVGIKAGGVVYGLVEIEFYYRNSLTENIESFRRTYPRKCNAGDLFLHYSGLDICFKTSEDDYKCCGGILIRSIINHENGVVIAGPLRCANEIINQCYRDNKKQLPIIVEHKNSTNKGIYATIRQGIETGDQFSVMRDNYKSNQLKEDQFPLFAYYIEGTEWPNDYNANPSIDYKRDVVERRGLYSKPI